MIRPSSIRPLNFSSSIPALLFIAIASSVTSFPSSRVTMGNFVQQNAQPQAQGSAQGLVQQGQDLIRTRQFSDAVEALRQAIQIEPNLASAHVQLSIASMGIGQRDEAFSEAKRAIELDPNDECFSGDAVVEDTRCGRA
jgi:Tfp pilus assembly protein PilF